VGGKIEIRPVAATLKAKEEPGIWWKLVIIALWYK